MKKSLALFTLRLIPRKKQLMLVSRALNYLLEDINLFQYQGSMVNIKLRDSKFAWPMLYNGEKFEPADNSSVDTSIELSFEDVVDFPSQDQIKTKLENGQIDIQGDPDYQRFLLELLENIDQVKITACIRHLRKMIGLKDQLIQDKELHQLTIRDIGCEADINYVCDQALQQEEKIPELAYKLMRLAHGARPRGPFIKRKLDEYQQRGFDHLELTSERRALQAIEVIEDQIGYFPIPKAACSSVKLALYKLKTHRDYDKDSYDGIHIHDYWTRQQKPLKCFTNKIIIIRDPIERFLSAYSNRVLDHGELNRGAIERDCPWLLKKLPHFRPNVSQFIESLDKYMLVPVIDHHCKALSWHVKNDLSEFTHIYPLENIGEFEKYLQEKSEEKFIIPRSHVGKNKVQLGQLTREELEALFVYFDDDYRLLAPWYSKEKLLNKWQKAHAKL